MNTEQTERYLEILEGIAFGLNKIGDALSSLSLYLWLPVYGTLFLLVLGIVVYFLV